MCSHILDRDKVFLLNVVENEHAAFLAKQIAFDKRCTHKGAHPAKQKNKVLDADSNQKLF